MLRPVTAFLFLCLLYALGLLVDLYASSLSPLAKALVLVGGLVVSASVYYWQFYRPTVRIEQKYLALVLDHLFATLMDRYRDLRPGRYELRVNVMPVRRQVAPRPAGLGGERRFLRIDFSMGDYSAAELEQEYWANVGCAGAALALNQQTYFDAVEAHEHRSGMTATQRLVTSHVGSILGTPI